MQMYKVEFQVHYENLVEVGVAHVNAQNCDAAKDRVITHLELPSSRTMCKVERIKPNLCVLERRNITKPKPKPMPAPDSLPSAQQKPAPLLVSVEAAARQNLAIRAAPNPISKFRCEASATISATNEDHALRLFADRIEMRARNRSLLGGEAAGFLLDCRLIPAQRELNTMEQIEIYQPKRFVKG